MAFFSRGVLPAALVLSLGVIAPAQEARAGALATEALVQQARASSARERVMAIVERADVARELERRGVDPREARARIAALGDAELERIAGRIDALPAGGSFGEVVLVVIVVFAALVITDLLGWTDVFPWVEPRR